MGYRNPTVINGVAYVPLDRSVLRHEGLVDEEGQADPDAELVETYDPEAREFRFQLPGD